MSTSRSSDRTLGGGGLRVAAAQARPVWLDRTATLAKVVELIGDAGALGVDLLAFPEAFLSGYPAWVCRTDGARFENPVQKEAFAQYLASAIEVPGPEVARVEEAARESGVFVYLGVSERGALAGRGTVWCTLLAIDPEEGLVGVHRKLMPTHDERLVWGRGDGHGLRCHPLNGVRVGGLSCWENWMPQARHALYADGETIHVGAWPGSSRLSADVTRFIAMEGRVFSIAACGLLSLEDVSDDFALADAMAENGERELFDGGSGVVGPDGCWIVGPVRGEEGLVVAEIDPSDVARARLSFDPTGHYARPDVFRVSVDRRRLVASEFVE